MDNRALIESFIKNHPQNTDTSYTLEGDYCPYFTPQEVLQFEGYYADGLNEEYFNLYTEVVSTNNADAKIRWYNEINKMMLEDTDVSKQNLISLGWNPEVRYTVENQRKAKQRFESIMNERRNISVEQSTDIIVESNEYIEESTKNGLYPIHIVVVRGNSPLSSIITKITNTEFSHAAIALGEGLDKVYSFNFDNKTNFGGGFSIEDVKEYPQENRLAVYAFFVTKQAYLSIAAVIQGFAKRITDTTYSVFNLVTFPFKAVIYQNDDKMICSQFVDMLLKIGNLNISNEKSSKVSPGNLYLAVTSNAKAYKIFDGLVKDFDPRKAARITRKLSKTAIAANESSTALIEARKIPIEVDEDTGDVLLTNPFPDYYAEYLNTHKLLLIYDKQHNYEAMKYELARLYYMNYILQRRLYHNKLLPNKKKNIDTRAKILNDFNKYLNKVCREEPEFNFAEYYENSPFYAHTIQIKGSTIGQIKDIIKYIL